MEYPKISVDRAVSHFVHDIDVDPAAMAHFYNDLRIENKPPLSECSVHFSALAWEIGDDLADGAYLSNPEHSKEFDPQAPPANILIGVGSLLAKDRLDGLSFVLQNELQSHALRGVTDFASLTDKEQRIIRAYRTVNSLSYRGLGLLAKTAAITGIVDLISPDMSFLELTPFGFGVAVAGSLISTRARNERRALREAVGSIWERQARKLIEYEKTYTDQVLATATPKWHLSERLLVRQQFGATSDRANSEVDAMHREASVRPA